MPEVRKDTDRLKFNRITTLPPLPRTAAQLLEVAGDPEVDIDQVVKIIEQDPPLTARILGLANSAYFGQLREINTVREAIIRVLGMNLVKSLSLSIAMAGSFDTEACREFSLKDYWYHSLGTATLARMVAQRANLADVTIVDSVYLCGLLHKLGFLLLAHMNPRELSAVLIERRQNPDSDLCTLEQEAIGIDHMVAGEWLVERWHLPEAVGTVIKFLNDSDYDGLYRFHLEPVRAASHWVDAEMYGAQISLSDDTNMLKLLQLDKEQCTKIETKFLNQCDELHTVSRLLS